MPIQRTLWGILYNNFMKIYPKGGIQLTFHYLCTLKGISMDLKTFIKEKRKLANLTQQEIAEKAGVGLRFIREMEQGKVTLRMDKVNQVLKLFGFELGPVEMRREEFTMNNKQ